MPRSSGPLRYTCDSRVGHKLIVAVDPGIVDLCRALVPRHVRLNVTRYAPHISVVRKEPVIDLSRWGEREGEIVDFEYDTFVHNDELYYWIRAYSDSLICVRRELGLTPYSEKSRPPDGSDCFHITIGNTK